MWTKSLGPCVGIAKQKKRKGGGYNPGVVVHSYNPSMGSQQGDLNFNAASTVPNKEGGGGRERKKVQGRNGRGDGKERKGRERREEKNGKGKGGMKTRKGRKGGEDQSTKMLPLS